MQGFLNQGGICFPKYGYRIVSPTRAEFASQIRLTCVYHRKFVSQNKAIYMPSSDSIWSKFNG